MECSYATPRPHHAVSSLTLLKLPQKPRARFVKAPPQDWKLKYLHLSRQPIVHSSPLTKSHQNPISNRRVGKTGRVKTGRVKTGAWLVSRQKRRQPGSAVSKTEIIRGIQYVRSAVWMKVVFRTYVGQKICFVYKVSMSLYIHTVQSVFGKYWRNSKRKNGLASVFHY